MQLRLADGAEIHAEGFGTIRYDLSGYGLSTRLTGEPFAQWQDLLALLDQVGSERAAVVGCSIGGAAAIDLAVARPERLWALVPVAAGLAGLEATPDEERWYEARMQGYDALVEAGDLEAAQDLELSIWAPLGTDDPAGAAIKRIARDNLHTLTMDTSGEFDMDPPAAGRLHDITAPTLVVEAEHDPPDMHRIADLLAAGIPAARRVSIDADHVVSMRRPEAFDSVVIPFLQSVHP